MSARHQAEKAALLESRKKWDQEVETIRQVRVITKQQTQQRIQTHNAQQTQAIQKQNRLGEEGIKSVLCPRIVEGPRKTRIRQGWSTFVAEDDIKRAKELVGGKIVENQL